MPFFWVFENDDILSSKSYTVTKSEISPQRKLGSLRNFRLFLLRYEVNDLELKILSFSKTQKSGILSGKICPLEIVKLVILFDIMH